MANRDRSGAADPVEAEIGRVTDLLRATGGRVTASRRAVVEALVTAPEHPTADDLAARVHQRHPTIHLSTVYRTLDALSDLGVVEHVHLGHGSAVYHLTGHDDLHLVCAGCGAVTHVDRSVLDPSAEDIERRTGHRLEPGHFALPSRCPACR